MSFEYVVEPTGPFELAVVDAGYKWIRTNAILKTRVQHIFDERQVDRLNMHSHSGPNTHLIVQGDLIFNMPSRNGLKTNHKIACQPDNAKEFRVERGRSYQATSETGAAFVEGHRSLSPGIAERFIARGTLRAVPIKKPEWKDYKKQLTKSTGSSESATFTGFARWVKAFGPETPWGSHSKWPGEATIMKWLREATFKPGDESGGFVLKWARRKNSPSEIEAKGRLERWFQREWYKPARPRLPDVCTFTLYDDHLSKDVDYKGHTQDSSDTDIQSSEDGMECDDGMSVDSD